jgi:hypothetical protein
MGRAERLSSFFIYFDLDFVGLLVYIISMGKYTHQELIKKLADWAMKKGTKHVSKMDIDADHDMPGSATFKRYFGSWTAALNVAGLEPGIITGRPQDPMISVSSNCLDIINGELLGDCSLSRLCNDKGNTCFSHSTSNIDYGKYLYNKLKTNDIPLLKEEFLPARNNGRPQFRTRTTTNKYWTELRRRWYPNGKKIVPIDLCLTKEVCLHWYLGDGYFEQGTSKISTCGFSYEENKYLSEMLTAMGFKATVNRRSGGYYIIRFSKYSFQSFLNWIGSCPVIGYEHRWGV